MKTKWMGLWEQDNGRYAGNTIKKGDIPKYARVVMMRNGYYKKDTNRPKYVFCFADKEGTETLCKPIEIEQESRPYEENGTYYTEDGERLYTRREVRTIIDGTASDVRYGLSEYDILPEDFVR